MAHVHATFDCKHDVDLEVSIEPDVEVPPQVRGLGKCSACRGDERDIAVAGVAPQPGGRLVVDSIMLMPVEG